MLLEPLAAFAAASIVLATSAFAAPAGDPLPDADSVLARVEKRAGDPAARAALKSLLARGTLAVGGMGGGKIELASRGADHTKISISWSGMGPMTQGTSGRFSWSTDPALGVTVREGDDRLGADRIYAIGRRTPWTALYSKAEVVGRADVEGRPCFELRMTPRTSGGPDRWFVDVETADLSRVDVELPNPTGGVIPVTWLFSDWQEVGGIRFAAHRVQRAATVELSFTYTEIVPNAELTDEQVMPPKDVQAAIDDPQRRTPRAPEKPGECAVETAEAQPVLTIRVTIKADEVSKNLAILFPEIGKYLREVGATPTGPPFSLYHSISDTEIDLEAGTPVAKLWPGGGRVKGSELPAGRVATTWHIGPYTDLMKTHHVLEDWMKAQKLVPRGPLQEIYWTDPGIETDPSKWKTQIRRPVE